MKATILKTLKSWSPKVKKARVKKQEFVVSATPESVDYKKWFNDNNSQ